MASYEWRMRVFLTQLDARKAGVESHVRSAVPLLERAEARPGVGDVLVLPELVGGGTDHETYVSDVARLARSCGAWVVGGSHVCSRKRGAVNCGVVVDPSGCEVARYEKSEPYAAERERVIGSSLNSTRFELGGRSVMVLICADFWYPASFESAQRPPDVVLVPALSVTQRPSPHVARARWRHAAVARAYELPAFVGISDWSFPATHPDGKSSGVAGLAHPNPARARDLFRAVGSRGIRAFDIDAASLEDLRANRHARRFLAGSLSERR